MSKTEILDELPKLTKSERNEIQLRLGDLEAKTGLTKMNPLTADERALLNARLAAYANDTDAGSTWKKLRVDSAPASVARLSRINLRLFVNGKLINQFEKVGSTVKSSEPVTFGSHSSADPGGYFVGLMHEVRAWSVARTEEE